VIAAIPDAVTNLAVAHWRSQRDFRRCLHLNLVMAVTCLVLTWLWLPRLGIAAAGLAWLTGEFAGALLVVAGGVTRRLTARRARKNRRTPKNRRAAKSWRTAKGWRTPKDWRAPKSWRRIPRTRPASRRKETAVR